MIFFIYVLLFLSTKIYSTVLSIPLTDIMPIFIRQKMQEETFTTIGSYKFCQKYCLGQGSFGKVYKGLRVTDNKVVAIKEIDITLVDQKLILNEATLLQQLKHPNIVEFYQAIRKPDYCYLIIEYCNSGDLAEYIAENSDGEPFSEALAQEIFFQICQGFSYLKQFNILHRDLKPNNIMVHNNVFKIGDFGLAKADNSGGTMTKTHVGSPIYMAPQILSKNYYTAKCDVWSLGVIFFELLFGELPWKTMDTGNILFKIMQNPNPHLLMNRKISQLSKMLLQGTLRYLEKDRLSFDDLRALKKNNKKRIFSLKPVVAPLVQSHHINSQLDFNNFQFHKYSNDLETFQKQILKHIYSQLFYLKQQVIKLTNKYCLRMLIGTCYNYMIEGSKKQQEFRDCLKIFLKLSSQNMSSYVIQLQSWDQAQDVLTFLELIHDFVTVKYATYQQYQRAFSRSMPAKIDIYAAVVISKINTYSRNNS